MRAVPLILMAAAMVLAGCGQDTAGADIPDREAPSAESIQQMPPEAQSAAQNAAKAGDAQSQRMEQMAEAKRQAEGGK